MENIFFKNHKIDVKCKPVRLRCTCDVPCWQGVCLKLTRTAIVGGTKLNLLFKNLMGTK